MAGKWHLGMTPDLLPNRRGFERSVAMADTGADNWEQKPYLPIYDKANWFEDGEALTLPEDFYSSKYFVDKLIEYISEDRKDGKPFFAYLPFQAVHFPVQAPREFSERYLGRYDEGWGRLRERRLQSAIALGLVPAGSEMITPATTDDWEALSQDEKRYASKSMAVYAGMIEAMDFHIGRLIEYLRETGAYDDTIFVFVSDNGSEGTDPFSTSAAWYMNLWMRSVGYDRDFDGLGERGSYVVIGPSFASAAASPLAYYKFFAREGGMRVPLMISGPGVSNPSRTSHALTWVTDLAPTLLEMTGIEQPHGQYRGRKVEEISGRSLVPLLDARSDRVYRPDETIGYELAGNAALFQGDYKIVKDRGPIGDDAWHLYDIVKDPGESRDLQERMPKRFAAMMGAYREYAQHNGVLPVPEGYDQRREVMYYGLRKQIGLGPALATVGAILTLCFFTWKRFAARRKDRVHAAG
jgi:arylsulfatase A-like enzyme